MLEEDEQVALLYTKGYYIGKQKLDNFIIVLYQLNDFYIEVFYSFYRKEIDHILCFKNPAFIDAYLTDVDINEFVDSTIFKY